MRVLFVQQDHVSPVGPVGDQFRSHGYDVEELLVVPAENFHEPGAVSVTFPDPEEYDAIVAMGAPWSVYDHAAIGAWVLEELAFLRRAHDAGVPILGICFGGQALAAALGASVVRAGRPEIGWHVVETEDASLIDPGPWFEWHHDKWVAPEGARVLARTADAEQAFVIGRTLAVQFHPELTPSTLDGWLANGGEHYLDAAGYDAAAIRTATANEAEAAERRSRALVDTFLSTVAVAET
jgi:GMP synthase-like glutamine amidotransferase